MKILFCALALPAAMFATAASAQVSFVNAAGNFNTPEPSTATVGLADSDGLAGNEYVSLGTPSAGQDTFLRFASAGGQPVTIGSQFSLGTLTYGNFETVANTAPASILFDVTTSLDYLGSSIVAGPFVYQFLFDFTLNARPCAYASTVPCADLVTFATPGVQTKTFSIGGERLTLYIDGFRNASGGVVTSFIGDEFTESSATLVGRFGVSAIPEPTTWALMILGFGAIGAAARRRRASFGGRELSQLA
jgi:hypothetical protein